MKKTKTPKVVETEEKTIGRPSDFAQEIADTICLRIAAGETLTEICKDLNVSRVTVYRWTRAHEEFRNAYAQAREDQMHSFADKILEKAQDDSRDYQKVTVEKLNKDGTIRAKSEEVRSDNTAVQRDRLIVDSMKFLMARLAPKYYGDKVEQTLKNPDGSGLSVVVNLLRKTPSDKKGN